VVRAQVAPATLLALVTALWLCAAPVAAQLPEFGGDEPVEITADRIDYVQERELYVAEGNVHVVQGTKSLRARWATFSGLTRLGVASGDIRYRDGGEVVDADFIQFDVDNLEGVLFGGELDLGDQQFRIAAQELVRVGEDRYRIFGARFTTCRCSDPTAEVPWELNAGRSEIEIGGYGTSRNTTMEVLGVPVIWLPWLMYPVKADRQTGLLVPRVSAGGRNGFAIAQPFFWAARHNLNITLTPGFSQDRGYQQGAEIETVHGRIGRTRLNGSFARDTATEETGNRFDPTEQIGLKRGFGELQHDQELPGDLRFKIDATYVSDNQYVLDFDDLRERRRDRFLESSAFIYGARGADGRLAFQLSSRFADDLQSTEFDDRDPYLLQRFIDFEAQVLTGPVGDLSWLNFGMDVGYEYFDRLEDPLSTFRQRGYTDPVTVLGQRSVDVGISAIPNATTAIQPPPPDVTREDGFYQEGEPLFDIGHRATIHPRIQVPLRLFDAVEWGVEAGWKQTLYYSKEREFEERGLATARSDLSIRMTRQYDVGRHQQIEHRMTPRLSWVYVSHDGGQDKNPLFTPRTAVTQYRIRQRDLDNLTLDPADEIPATNRLVASLDHRLYRTSRGRRALIGEFGLGFDYDFASGGRVGRFIAEARGVRLGWSMSRAHIAIDAQRGTVDEVSAVTTIRWPWRITTTFGYRFVPDGPDFFEAFQTAKFKRFSADFDEINQVSGAISLPLYDRFRVNYRANYTFAGAFFLTNTGSIDYISTCDCWAAGFQISQSRDDNLRFQFRYTVVGIGDDAQNPFAGAGWFRTD